VKINRMIDHTILDPDLSVQEAVAAIQSGLAFDVHNIIIRPCDIELAKTLCRGSNTEVSSVIACPHGLAPFDVKRFETQRYIAEGTDELDLTVNHAFIRNRQWESLEKEIEAISILTRPSGVCLKVVLEAGWLSTEEVRMATRIAVSAQADYVSLSIGITEDASVIERSRAILDVADGRIKVKVSGVLDREQGELLLAIGVHRLGVPYLATSAVCDPCRGRLKTAQAV